MARLYAKTGQNKNAIEEMKKIPESKKDAKYLVTMADLFMKEERYKEVENIISDLKLREPENIEGLMLLGKAQSAQKKYDEALNTFKEVSTIDQNYAPAYYETAELCLITQKVLMADLFYKRALQRDPKFALAELGLAKLAKSKKNDQEYRMHLENARKLDPKNGKILEEISNLKN
jgi:tetratricopeptide (TPR) repeat protein